MCLYMCIYMLIYGEQNTHYGTSQRLYKLWHFLAFHNSITFRKLLLKVR